MSSSGYTDHKNKDILLLGQAKYPINFMQSKRKRICIKSIL